jgi:signal transduction histidine kinase
VSTSRRALGDDLLVRRAAREVALRAAGLVALSVLLLAGLVTGLFVQGQRSAEDALLRGAAASADDVVDPPPGSWLVLTRGAQVLSSPGLPNDLTPVLAKLRNDAGPRTVLIDVRDAPRHREYRIATERRSGEIVQVALDLTGDHQQRSRLLTAMGAACLLGLVFAVGLGVLLGRRAVRPLAQALRLQRTFVADASHELRAPLTVLSTRVQVLDLALQGAALPAAVLADSRGVLQDVQRLGEVVEDLLVAADPAGQEAHQPVELRQLVEDVVASATAHGIQAGVRLRGDGDRPGPPCWVLGAAPALRRAVLALIDNAIDHTPSGGEVRVTTRRERHQVIVSVSDTGPGIDPALGRDVLRRFHSGAQRSGRVHYGLGLALTHDVANRHGGQLRLAAAEVGTTFELVVPEAELDLPETQH